SSGARLVVFTDRQWFTAGALRRMLQLPPGRMRVTDELFWRTNGAQQIVPAPGVMEIGWGVVSAEWSGSREALDAQAPVSVELDLEDHGLHAGHPRLQHAHRPLRVGAASVHLVQHWTHLMRINQLAIQAEAYAARDRFQEASLLQKVVHGVRTVWRAGGWSEPKLAAVLVTVGAGCTIHPTAVVEASRIGAGVTIGPGAVVQGSVLQDGVMVDAHATVVSSVMGSGSRIGPYGHLRHSTLFPGARVSAGPGYQMCVFGRDCFLAWGVAALDLSFGQSIRTETAPGVTEDSTHHFLGCAVGHEAVIGQGVRLAPGAVVPSGATLVATTDGLYRRWGDHPVDAQPVRPTRQGVTGIGASGEAARDPLHVGGSRRDDALFGDDTRDESSRCDIEGEISSR
ncbi:MAG TPA: hypothetical protein DFR83_19195, partial [Deltaproteobacteria bacterium]|nr:hypothetical protein [Deltaproteobacteria bacterium]